eukprot:755749-Hanusia_phi.AAC.2
MTERHAVDQVESSDIEHDGDEASLLDGRGDFSDLISKRISMLTASFTQGWSFQAEDAEDLEGTAGGEGAVADDLEETTSSLLDQTLSLSESLPAQDPPPPVTLNGPHAVAVLSGGISCIVIADCWANRILLTTREGMEFCAIGTGAEGHADDRVQDAAFNGPHGLCVNTRMELFVADAYNQAVRRVSAIRVNLEAKNMEELVHAEVVTRREGREGTRGRACERVQVLLPARRLVSGAGRGQEQSPFAALTCQQTEQLLVADFDNNCIRKIFISNGSRLTRAGCCCDASTQCWGACDDVGGEQLVGGRTARRQHQGVKRGGGASTKWREG